MITKLRVIIYCTCLLTAVSVNAFAVDHYELIKKSNDISLYSLIENKNNLPTIQARFTVPVEKTRVLCLLKDTSINPLWVPNSLGASIVKSPAINEKWVVFKTKMPFPFKNRDGVLSFKQYQRDGNVTYIEMTSLPHKLQKEIFPVQPGFVRITKSQGSWLIEPRSAQSTQIVYQNFVDLGGKIPKWVVRAGLKEVTFKTALNFIKLSLNASIKCPGNKAIDDG